MITSDMTLQELELMAEEWNKLVLERQQLQSSKECEEEWIEIWSKPE